MTPEQRKLAEDNVKLIYAFMWKYNFKIEDFDYILLHELCKAAINYDPESGYEFSTLAYTYFYNAVCNEINKNNKIINKFDSSIDEYFERINGKHEKIESTDPSPYDHAVAEDLLNRLYKCCKNERGIYIINKLVEGYDGGEIGKQLGISRQRVNMILKEIRTKYLAKYGDPMDIN